jgi:geranylgeranyl pyrophosphate synthase
LIYLLERADGNQDVQRIRTALIQKRYDSISREQLMDHMVRVNAFSDAERKAKHYAALAKEDLSVFEPSDAKTAMLDLLDFVIQRSW